MPGINFDPLIDDDDMTDQRMRQDNVSASAPIDESRIVGGTHSHEYVNSIEDEEPDELDKRNRTVMFIDHIVSIAGFVLCIASVFITANTLISPLGL